MISWRKQPGAGSPSREGGDSNGSEDDAFGPDDETVHPEEEPDGPSGSQEGPPTGEPVVLPIEDVLDLHSFDPKEIESLVNEYLAAAHAAGFQAVRIIHGRGVGVQREIVRSVLARTPFVISFEDAPARFGGWGATIAVLIP